jgi:hypothetical protein
MARPVLASVTTGPEIAGKAGAEQTAARPTPSVSKRIQAFRRAADIVVADIAPNRMLPVIIASTQ